MWQTNVGFRGRFPPVPQHKVFNLIVTAIASGLSRLSGLVTVVVAGWFLSEAEFGVYAIATGVTTFTLLLRGGGSGLLLQTMTPKEFADIGGSLARVALTFALVGLCLTALSVRPANAYYQHDDLGSTLMWLAASMFIFQLGTFPRGKVASALRFEKLAFIDIVAAATKLGVAYWCASRGWGAATLAVALAASTSVQTAGALIWADLSPSDFRVAPGWGGRMVTLLKLPLLISILITIAAQIDTFVASFFVPVATLGIYFFAANIATAPVQLVVGAIKSVLAPYAARARGSAKQERAAMEATFASGTLFAPLALMLLATIYPSLSRLLWDSKWEASVWPVMLGCALLIYPTIQGLLEGPVMGLRDWREYFSILSWRAGSRLLGAIAAVVAVWQLALPAQGTAIALTVGVGGFASIVAFFQIRSLLRRYGVDQEMVAFEIHSPTIYAVVALVATHGVVASILDSATALSLSGRGGAAIECALCFTIFSLIALALLRFAYLGKLGLILAAVPNPLRAAILRMLRIQESTINPLED